MDDDSHGSETLLQASADTGGTFTDVVLRHPGGRQTTSKVLSSGVVRFVLEGVDGSCVTLAGTDIGAVINNTSSGAFGDGVLDLSDSSDLASSSLGVASNGYQGREPTG